MLSWTRSSGWSEVSGPRWMDHLLSPSGLKLRRYENGFIDPSPCPNESAWQ
ncbi:unnamed protein product, partial [Strongylus vulgaris]